MNYKIINYHNAYPVITFAVDIFKLNKFGNRANSLYPNVPQEYDIFGETIYSPCEGKVLYASDNMPDQNPPEKDAINVGGNYVVLEYKGVQIFLCHMMKESILVKEGDFFVVPLISPLTCNSKLPLQTLALVRISLSYYVLISIKLIMLSYK